VTHRIHIKAGQPWWVLGLREIWEYRDLLLNLVLRDLTANYKQSILGPLWFVLVPLATTIVFTVIFGNIARIGTDGIPPFLFYLCGLVLWNYFQGCFNGVSGSVIANTSLFTKVYFPRLIVPLSIVIGNLAQLLLNLVMFGLFYCYYLINAGAGITPTPWILAMPLLVLHCAAVGLGTGLWVCAATIRYRDLSYALPFVAQLWMFATPIIYPASSVSSRWYWVLALNPLSGVMEFNRHAFFGRGEISGSLLAANALSAVIILATGILIFTRVQRRFVDTI